MPTSSTALLHSNSSAIFWHPPDLSPKTALQSLLRNALDTEYREYTLKTNRKSKKEPPPSRTEARCGGLQQHSLPLVLPFVRGCCRCSRPPFPRIPSLLNAVSLSSVGTVQPHLSHALRAETPPVRDPAEPAAAVPPLPPGVAVSRGAAGRAGGLT